MEDMCVANAYINCAHAYKELGLSVKFGSLAFYEWYEYGGEGWGWEEFSRRHKEWAWLPSHAALDLHCWLEDAEGNVYDMVMPSWTSICKMRTGKDLGIRVGPFEKWSKPDLRSLGLNYQAASAEDMKLATRATASWVVVCMKSWPEVQSLPVQQMGKAFQKLVIERAGAV